MSGLKLAALYSLKPHQLGFCGPQDKKNRNVLFNYLKGKKTSKERIRKILKGFKGAHPYYKLIAKSNNIKNPFDEQVVRAYWVGSKLLENVKITIPHHNFHVLLIGSVTGRIVLRGRLLDLCRIGWGRVIKIKNLAKANTGKKQKIKNKILIKYQPLVGKKKLRLGKFIEKEIDWDEKLMPNVKIEDWVSFHWNQAVEILTNKDVKNLEKYTELALSFLNNF